MLFSEEWLRHYINPPLSSEALCETLTMGGLEVEGSEPIAPAFTGIVVAQVLTVENHPNADKLHVCTVDVGEGDPVQIVCGAPNVAPGIKVPCAKIGAVLPGDFKIKKAKLRGVESNGMLCSSRELGISEDHSGLWILPADAPVGEDIRTYERLDDRKIEIKLTPNRGDALSIIGVGRDLRAMTGAELAQPDMSPVEANCDAVHNVKIEAPDLCGRFSGRVIKGLNPNAPTPDWMKSRLERSGQRSISALVDISNYVLLELGRPTHIFDLDKLDGTLTVRWGKEGEKAGLLNGKTVDIDPYFGVISDNNGIEAIGGIMGGAHAAVSDDTVNIFIESAFWWPVSIQGRCRKLNFSTDAAYRFERGVDFGTTVEHLEYTTRLIKDICGTAETQIGPVVDMVESLPERKPVKMRIERCRKIIGADISEDKMAECFTRLGFNFEKKDGAFLVESPTYRFDIEIEEDLIEEVARLYGYQNLTEIPPLARVSMLERNEDTLDRHELRKKMAALGFQEQISYSFVAEEEEADFSAVKNPIKVLNPIASQMAVMRTQLIAGLVNTLKYNLNRKTERAALFEYGRVFFRDKTVKGSDFAVEGVRQPVHLGALVYGSAYPAQWGEKARPYDFFDLKGVVEQLTAGRKLRFEKSKNPALHPGRSADVYLDGDLIGVIGELHPALAQKYDLPHSPVVFELDAEPLLKQGLLVHKPISKFQPVSRDISVSMASDIALQKLTDAVAKAAKKDPRLFILSSFKLFDVYQPKDDVGQKSLAFSARFQRMDSQVSDAEADEAVQAILNVLAEQGAVLRQ
ncbi:phenylalanine--tRNA ligase subunit beta [uncultured Parasutterella sp.]|uniref:phenylalanine--tRNA ligase subunit beta n=1 Tax=uncultured Parasutterella sp. TaxID=1263098 RepID=UPI0025B2EA00|nr:phenylalanine--tRNA ligase subunit beta [uncultured Parasutterella sp.]